MTYFLFQLTCLKNELCQSLHIYPNFSILCFEIEFLYNFNVLNVLMNYFEKAYSKDEFH